MLCLRLLLNDLTSRPLAPNEEKALADFQSGNYIPVGACRHEKVLAAGIATLETFPRSRQDPRRQSNLFATPDEERGSRGMRSLRDALPELAERYPISLPVSILTQRAIRGAMRKYGAIYRGTIGKQLPFAFVVDKAWRAIRLKVSARISRRKSCVRWKPMQTLCDTADGEVLATSDLPGSADFAALCRRPHRNGRGLLSTGLFHSVSPDALFHSVQGNCTVRRWIWAITRTSMQERFAKLVGMMQMLITRAEF